MSEPKILAEDENTPRRLVELEATHNVDEYGSSSLLYTASMTESGVRLRRISSGDPVREFYLDVDVMNALAAGWAKFQADIEARARAEKQHNLDIITEAYALAARYPEIKIESDGTASPSWWRVSCPSQGVAFRQVAYYPAQLLEQVNECVAFLPNEDIQATA